MLRSHHTVLLSGCRLLQLVNIAANYREQLFPNQAFAYDVTDYQKTKIEGTDDMHSASELMIA